MQLSIERGHHLGAVAGHQFALAAQFGSYFWVVAGTTLGMLLANVPVVFFGDRITAWIPTRVVHGTAAATFIVLGVLALIGFGQ